MTFFSENFFPLFSLIFRIFTLLHNSFLTTKTLSSQEKHLFYFFHTFAHIRQHYFSKYWGDECMDRPPLKLWGDRPPVPPRLPPLSLHCRKTAHTHKNCLDFAHPDKQASLIGRKLESKRVKLISIREEPWTVVLRRK